MNKKRPLGLTIAAILVYFFLYAPIIVLVLFAFNESRTNVLFTGFVNKGACGPFYWFCQLADNRELMGASKNTLLIAFVSTIFSTIIGTMAAMALQRFRFRGKTAAESALYLPIVIPEIVMGIGILTLFGVLFRWLNDTLGLAGDSKLAMGIGTVIISHITFSVPFVTLVVRARLVGFDTSLEEAAMDLGANEITTFWRITLPLILPGVLSGGLLAFTLSLDDFVITFFTTGPGASTLPIYVYGLLRRITTPELNALSTIWILLVLVALLLTQRLEKKQSDFK